MRNLVIVFVPFLLMACSQIDDLTGKTSSISGTITIDPALASKVTPHDRLFIIARQPEGGPPLAVQRIVGPQFPLKYWLTKEDVMMPGMEFAGKTNVIARIDKDGNAGPPQPGDMEGAFKGNPVQVGEQNVDVVIDKLYEEKTNP